MTINVADNSKDEFPTEQAVELARFIESHYQNSTVDLVAANPLGASYRIKVERLAIGKAP